MEARGYIVNALNSYDFGRSERLVRINPVGSGYEQDDIKTVKEFGGETSGGLTATTAHCVFSSPLTECFGTGVRWFSDLVSYQVTGRACHSKGEQLCFSGNNVRMGQMLRETVSH